MSIDVKSLRCLSHICVQELGIADYSGEDIPASLREDLDKARLFCGDYVENVETNSGQFLTALSIQYDGVNWTFAYQSNFWLCLCCYNCDFVQPSLFTSIVQENVPCPFFPLSI